MKYILIGDFDYRRILNFVIDNSKYVSFCHNKRVKSDNHTENYNNFIATAKMNRISEYEICKFALPRYRAKQSLILCELSSTMKKAILKTNSFDDWDSCNYPEDIAFYDSRKSVWFYTISHENMVIFDSDDESIKNNLCLRGVHLEVIV